MSAYNKRCTDLQEYADDIATLTGLCIDTDDPEAIGKLCRLSHEFTVAVRSLFYQVESYTKIRDELEALGYSFERCGEIVIIRLPLLLPKRAGNVEFITEPLDKLLSLYPQDKRFEECTIFYEQVYRLSEKKPSIMRDADNLEVRSVQNVIERYLLTTDSANMCTTVHVGKHGVRNETVITITPGKLDVASVCGVMS